jgi:hypothetical protein
VSTNIVSTNIVSTNIVSTNIVSTNIVSTNIVSTKYCANHGHLRKIYILMAHTACLVYLDRTVLAATKIPLEEAALVAGS